MTQLDFHNRDRAPLPVIIYWTAVLCIIWILGSLHAAYWQIAITCLLVWFVRYTSRWEVL